MNEMIQAWPVLAFAAVFVGLLYAISQWCIQDAIRRGRSPVSVSLLVFLLSAVGWIIWLNVRPPILDPVDRPLTPVDKADIG